jgi:hypothetical protein
MNPGSAVNGPSNHDLEQSLLSLHKKVDELQESTRSRPGSLGHSASSNPAQSTDTLEELADQTVASLAESTDSSSAEEFNIVLESFVAAVRVKAQKHAQETFRTGHGLEAESKEPPRKRQKGKQPAEPRVTFDLTGLDDSDYSTESQTTAPSTSSHPSGSTRR